MGYLCPESIITHRLAVVRGFSDKVEILFAQLVPTRSSGIRTPITRVEALDASGVVQAALFGTRTAVKIEESSNLPMRNPTP